jgi:hypothetical protein
MITMVPGVLYQDMRFPRRSRKTCCDMLAGKSTGKPDITMLDNGCRQFGVTAICKWELAGLDSDSESLLQPDKPLTNAKTSLN